MAGWLHPRAFVRLLAAAVLLATGACATRPPDAGARDDQSFEREHRRILARFGGVLDAPAAAEHVAAVAARLEEATPGAPDVRLVLLDDASPNAFSLPGGYIYLTRGVLALANDDAEVAAILAHEIAHVRARHALQRRAVRRRAAGDEALADVLANADTTDLAAVERREAAVLAATAEWRRFSRLQELEADRLAVSHLAAAGLDPTAMARMLQRLQAYRALGDGGTPRRSRRFASHPLLAERIVAAAAAADAAVAGTANGRGEAPRAGLLAAVDGLIFGADPDVGIVIGRRFVQPRLGIIFTLPAGFDAVHDDDWLIGRGPDGLVLLFDAPRIDARRAPVTGARLTVQRFDAPATLAGSPARTHTALLRDGEGAVFRLRFVTPGRFSPGDRRAIATAVESFRTLDERELAEFPRRVIEVVRVAPGEGIDDLTRRLEVPQAERLFRLLNGLDDDEPVGHGDVVKIVRRLPAPAAQTTSRASNPSSS